MKTNTENPMDLEGRCVMSETTVEVEAELLRYHVPGWGEAKMELLAKAQHDLEDATALLDKIKDGLNFDDSRLHGMAIDKIKTAIIRVDLCDLDC